MFLNRASTLGCSGLLLSNFGEKTYVGLSAEGGFCINPACALDFDNFKDECRRLVKYLDNNSKDKLTQPPVMKMAMVLAITCDTQPIIEGYLRQLGFDQSGPHVRTKYTREGGVSVWVMGVADFLQALDLPWDKPEVEVTSVGEAA